MILLIKENTLKQDIIKSEEQMLDTHKKLTDQDSEGSVIKNPMSYYEQKRSKNMLKIKDFKDDECEVIDYEISDSEHMNGILGALLCKWIHSNKNIVFKVGSGFKVNERPSHYKCGIYIEW